MAIDVDGITPDPSTALSTFVRSGLLGTATPPNTPPAGKPHIVTANVDLTNTNPGAGQTNLLEPWAVATVNGESQAFVGRRVAAVTGEDVGVKICDDTLLAASNKSSLAVSSAQRATLSFTAADCGLPRTNVPMRYEIVGDTLGSTLVAPTTPTNGTGKASVQLTAGTQNGVVTVRAFAEVGLNRSEVSRDLKITMGEGLAVHYLWRETLLDWHADATNQWGAGQRSAI